MHVATVLPGNSCFCYERVGDSTLFVQLVTDRKWQMIQIKLGLGSHLSGPCHIHCQHWGLGPLRNFSLFRCDFIHCHIPMRCLPISAVCLISSNSPDPVIKFGKKVLETSLRQNASQLQSFWILLFDSCAFKLSFINLHCISLYRGQYVEVNSLFICFSL